MDFEQINWQKLEQLHPELANVFKKHGSQKLEDYSRWLWSAPKPQSLDANFVGVLAQHLGKIGCPATVVKLILTQLAACPVLQTAHHLAPTNGPTFATTDLIALCGKPKDYFYLVGVCTGLPFSNVAWSGALSYSNTPLEQLVKKSSPTWYKALRAEKERASKDEQRLSLIAAKHRDARVFQSKQNYLLPEVWQDLQPKTQQLLGPPEAEFYSEWALKSCQNIQKRLFNNQQIVYFDLNLVIANYIRLNLGRAAELDWLINPEQRALVEKVFGGNPTLFLTTKPGKKSTKVQRLSSQQVPTDLAWLEQALAEDSFCPSIFLVFFVLLCMVGLHCWGSFHQIKYLKTYIEGWQSLGYQSQSHGYLTSGRLLGQHVPEFEHPALWPLDQVLRDQPVVVEQFKDIQMQHLWQPFLQKIV